MEGKNKGTEAMITEESMKEEAKEVTNGEGRNEGINKGSTGGNY